MNFQKWEFFPGTPGIIENSILQFWDLICKEHKIDNDGKQCKAKDCDANLGRLEVFFHELEG